MRVYILHLFIRLLNPQLLAIQSVQETVLSTAAASSPTVQTFSNLIKVCQTVLFCYFLNLTFVLNLAIRYIEKYKCIYNSSLNASKYVDYSDNSPLKCASFCTGHECFGMTHFYKKFSLSYVCLFNNIFAAVHGKNGTTCTCGNCVPNLTMSYHFCNVKCPQTGISCGGEVNVRVFSRRTPFYHSVMQFENCV